ncbi:MAG: AbrB/MazE/SpoVT family DNA-binding domain-containing protein [Thermomicrobiales bacterium]|nr:AbrB/MazE/SpoVT family DNA-binding domain-containing protein [Thermomicrobiales bacterium]
MTDHERRTVRLGRAGGSSTVVLPKAWLTELAVGQEVDLVKTEQGILVVPHHEDTPSIEDEPEFARFLDFLSHSALAHGDTLIEATSLLAGDEELFADVEHEDDPAEAVSRASDRE